MDETWLTSIREEAAQRAAELAAAVEAWKAGDPATRERWRLDRARMLAQISARRLAEADETQRVEARRAAARARRAVAFAPPSLQDLVAAHGAYDRITREAWATFEVEMVEWKAKMRAGESHGDDAASAGRETQDGNSAKGG